VIVLASESPTSETGAGAPPNASTSPVPSPALNPTPGEGTTTDRRAGPFADSAPNSAPGQQESTQTVTPSEFHEDAGRDYYLEPALAGAAEWTVREQCADATPSTVWSNPASESRASRTDRRRNGWPAGHELLWGA
jgi:hypothetical protein